MKYNVSFEVVTEESVVDGEAQEHGLIATGVSLREAIDHLFDTRTNQVDGVAAIEADSDPHSVSVYNGREFITGDQESRHLHFPATLTASSRRRLARLVKGTS